MKPTKGRIVFYTMGTGEIVAAIVVKVDPEADEVVNLRLFTDDTFCHHIQNVQPGAAGVADSWHWPPRS